MERKLINNIWYVQEEVSGVYRPEKSPEKRESVKYPSQTQAYLEDIRHKPNEYFKLLCLNVKCEIIREEIIAIGTLNAALVHPREVFRPAILANSATIIIAHNHPSADPEPSEADNNLTRTLVDAGKILDIRINDHIIITPCEFTSMREKDPGLFL